MISCGGTTSVGHLVYALGEARKVTRGKSAWQLRPSYFVRQAHSVGHVLAGDVNPFAFYFGDHHDDIRVRPMPAAQAMFGRQLEASGLHREQSAADALFISGGTKNQFGQGNP